MLNMELDMYYNFSHKKRGHALIFNHEQFSNVQLSSRTGTNIDCENLCETLTSLHFQVSIYKDKNFSEILSVLEKISSSDHSESDCILISVLTHGACDEVWAKDRTYKLDCLYSFFVDDMCPSLAGKPKIFVIQACQGWMRISPPSHFLIFSSFMKLRKNNNIGGLWFIESLCEQLRINGKRYDIFSLLRSVMRECNNLDPQLNILREVPCVTSTLTRFFTFNNKIKHYTL